MTPSGFAKWLEQGKPPAPVYLFRGDAEFLMEEAWGALLEKLVPEKARRFNGERLQARDCQAGQVIARLSTVSMFGGKNLLMLQNVELWPKDQLKDIQDYVAKPHPSACLVLTAGRKKGLEKLEAAIASGSGATVEFVSPSEREAPKWLQERAKLHGKRLGPQAASLLVEHVGVDLLRLEQELEKLRLYTGERKTIDPEDVQEVVGLQRSYTIFELVRYVAGGQSSRAVASLRSLLLAGEAPLAILGLLTRQIRSLWQVKDGADRGLSIALIAQQTKLPPFVVKEHARQTAHFTEKELRRIHRKLRETDLTLKSSGTSPEMALESLIVDLCRRR
jgi:DNA polymerase-3 subunit delta